MKPNERLFVVGWLLVACTVAGYSVLYYPLGQSALHGLAEASAQKQEALTPFPASYKGDVLKVEYEERGYEDPFAGVNPFECPKCTIILWVDATAREPKIQVMNIVEPYRRGMRLPFGKYRVRVSKPGYQTVEEWVELTPYDKHYERRFIRMPEG
ncbi:PEGA domain-containing protein [Marinobacter sp. VGCF2001]|uniref:PEGA domain-containing protein n=1 Tax=Marinobacter sp. VGCF2001 TaxID=3417189 RepID=UPI003CF60EB6